MHLKLVIAFKEIKWYMIRFAQVVQHVPLLPEKLCLLMEYHCCNKSEISSSLAFVAALETALDDLT